MKTNLIGMMSIVMLTLTGCVPLGYSKIRYTQDVKEFKKIGIVQLEALNFDEEAFVILNSIYVGTVLQDTNFNQHVFEVIDEKFYSNYDENDMKRDIREIIVKHKLDGFLTTLAEFSAFQDAEYRRSDVKMTMILYNHNGEKVVKIKFNTATGKSYWSPPSGKEVLKEAIHVGMKKLKIELDKIKDTK